MAIVSRVLFRHRSSFKRVSLISLQHVLSVRFGLWSGFLHRLDHNRNTSKHLWLQKLETRHLQGRTVTTLHLFSDGWSHSKQISQPAKTLLVVLNHCKLGPT